MVFLIFRISNKVRADYHFLLVKIPGETKFRISQILLPKEKSLNDEFAASDFKDLVNLHDEQCVDTRVKQISLELGEDYTPEAVRGFFQTKNMIGVLIIFLIAGDEHLIGDCVFFLEGKGNHKNRKFGYVML